MADFRLFSSSGRKAKGKAVTTGRQDGGKGHGEGAGAVTGTPVPPPARSALPPPPSVPRPRSWPGLGLSPWLCASCTSMGMYTPTEVQMAVVPQVLAGKDVVACSQTGSGKTAAFALPILEKLAEDPYGVFAVVLTAGRELAQQIADQFIALGSGMTLRVAVVTGGADIVEQSKELARMPHIIVATPGRLSALLQSGTDIRLSGVQYLVLDEADRLLDTTIAPDLDVVLAALPPAHTGRRTLLFSATISKNMARLETLALEEPFKFSATPEATTVGELLEEYVLVPKAVKACYLVHVLDKAGPAPAVTTAASDAAPPKHKRGSKKGRPVVSAEEVEEAASRASAAVVFVNTIYTAQFISELLQEMGILCVCLHSAMNQRRRIAAIAKFKSSLVHVLVATDVASRGLDIPQVELVVNYDVPQAPADYIHRVGRTARAGRGGRAVTLVTQYDVELIHEIESKIGKQLTDMPEVSEEEALKFLKPVSTGMKVVSMRLVETGFDEALQVVKDRKESSKKRVSEWVEGLKGEEEESEVAPAPEPAPTPAPSGKKMKKRN